MIGMISGSVYLSDTFCRNPTDLTSDRPVDNESEPICFKVLVVDDERLIADTISEILKRAGFHVVTAYDGWEALQSAGRFRPDYLLSDVLMLQMNGVELAIAIQKMHPAAKILLFSGQAGISEILLSGQRQGLKYELIAKPIHPLKLIEILKDQE
jgi:CheY-like chemotaxis protein